jgi:hypothetical protein
VKWYLHLFENQHYAVVDREYTITEARRIDESESIDNGCAGVGSLDRDSVTDFGQVQVAGRVGVLVGAEQPQLVRTCRQLDRVVPTTGVRP